MAPEPPRSGYRLTAFGRLVDLLEAGHTEMVERPFNAWEQSGFIQHFELAAELGWKLLADLLREGGADATASPKGVVRAAFAAGLIADGQGWIDIIDARNSTAHMYDHTQLEAWLAKIRNLFLPLLVTLRDTAAREAQT